MPTEGLNTLHCYNRGCGQTFDPNENREDSCTFHPGAPFFHDAYKGWSCCKKKCTDFTEFLNIKGCTKSYHSNMKPPEPERPPVDKSKSEEVIEYKAPVIQRIERPSSDLPLVDLIPEVSPTLVIQANSLQRPLSGCIVENKSSEEISIGTACKNGGCKQIYEGPETPHACTHHPGYPVFHEGLKFWSCCQRRTTDFSNFLDQEGCFVGEHVWVKEKEEEKVKCRYDWHQTSNNVIVSVFAKKYDPNSSFIRISPVRLEVHIFFPEEDSSFDLDLQLHGVIDTNQSSAAMLPTKLEIKLRKAEPGSWSKLEFPSTPLLEESAKPVSPSMDKLVPEVDAVDLSDL